MNSKYLLILLAIAVVANSTVMDLQWETYKLKYERVYTNDREEMYRYQVFQDNLERIKQYQAENPEAEYGITEYADLTEDEFEKQYLGLDPTLARPTQPLGTLNSSNLIKDIPESYDWRDQGAVTPAKDQYLCGSCWAFSAVGNIEGQYFLKTKKLIPLSVQQLVDCDTNNKGCDGGYMQMSFDWLATTDGLETWEDYPYTGWPGKCKMNHDQQLVKVKGYLNISSDETDIAKALVQYGPLATGMNGNVLQFYRKGVLKPLVCKDKLNHGVLFVGYGTEKGTDFWTVKNSWGPDFGENGVFRIVRGKARCAINIDVSTVVLA